MSYTRIIIVLTTFAEMSHNNVRLTEISATDINL